MYIELSSNQLNSADWVVDSSKAEIENYVQISHVSIQGGCSVIFGMPFFTGGLFLLCSINGWLSLEPIGEDHEKIFLSCLASIFLIPGLALVLNGISGFFRSHRIKQLKKLYPHNSEKWDFSWNETGIRSTHSRELLSGLFFLLLISLFLAPMNYYAFKGDSSSSLLIKGVVIFFDLILGYVVFYSFKKTLELVKYNKVHLRFESFPFRLGETIKLSLLLAPLKIETLWITVTCIQEKYEMRDYGEERRSEVVSYRIYELKKEIRNMHHSSDGDLLNITVPLPPNPGYATELSARPARYWTIEFKGERKGLDYESRFLLPIYK